MSCCRDAARICRCMLVTEVGLWPGHARLGQQEAPCFCRPCGIQRSTAAFSDSHRHETDFRVQNCRTPEEFAEGRCPGAINIPFMLKGAEGTHRSRQAVRSCLRMTLHCQLQDSVFLKGAEVPCCRAGAQREVSGGGEGQVPKPCGGQSGCRLPGRRPLRKGRPAAGPGSCKGL